MADRDFQDMTLREIRAAYYTSVRAIAEEARELGNSDEDERDADDDREELETFVHEAVDGSEWVIYTYRSKLVAIVSDNSDAGKHDGGLPESPESLAYFAMRADVEQLIESLDELDEVPA